MESPALFIIYRDVLDTKMCEQLTDFEIGYLFFISIFYFCISFFFFFVSLEIKRGKYQSQTRLLAVTLNISRSASLFV